MNTQLLSKKIKAKALELGFSECGFAKAEELTNEAQLLEKWLTQKMHGKMQYMENHFEKRIDPTKLVEGAKSVISLSYNYFPAHQQPINSPKIAKYAFGKDYHLVVKKKLNELFHFIGQEVGQITGRCFVDSAPVLERSWAQRAGIGWVGKNTLLLTKKRGSYFFLAEIILDVEFTYDSAVKNYCGSCTKCVDACPTQALYAPYQLDANKCISYLTIELKDKDLPTEFKNNMQNWAFGCDICQDVCPINGASKPTTDKELQPTEDFLSLSENDWLQMTEDVFLKLFQDSAIKRTKWTGMQRNIRFLKK